MSTQNTAPDFGEPWEFSRGEPSIKGRDDDEILTGVDYTIDDEKIKRAVVCVNACAGMTDPAAEIAAMREAISEAHKALTTLEACGGIGAESMFDDARSALAKLKPFLP